MSCKRPMLAKISPLYCQIPTFRRRAEIEWYGQDHEVEDGAGGEGFIS